MIILRQKEFGFGSWLQARQEKKLAKEQEKKEKVQKFKEDVVRIYKEFKLDVLSKIYDLPKIKSLLKEADCYGWDDYEFVTCRVYPMEEVIKSYNPTSWVKMDEEMLAEFGNADPDGILYIYPENGEVTLGDISITSKNFKQVLLKYLQGKLDWWKKEWKEAEKEIKTNKDDQWGETIEEIAGCNYKFIQLQEEIIKEIKQKL